MQEAADGSRTTGWAKKGWQQGERGPFQRRDGEKERHKERGKKIERVKETKAEVNRDRGKGGPSQRGERSSLNKANQSEQVG